MRDALRTLVKFRRASGRATATSTSHSTPHSDQQECNGAVLYADELTPTNITDLAVIQQETTRASRRQRIVR